MQDAYTVLGGKLGYPDNPKLREVLEFLMTPEQAQLVSLLPCHTEELAPKLGMDVESVKKHIDELFLKGVIFPKNFQTREGAKFANNIIQLHDGNVSILSLDPEKEPKIFDLWEDFRRNGGFDRDYAQMYAKFPAPPSRVVPAYRTVKDVAGFSPVDDIREVLKTASRIAVVPCACRKRAKAEHRECYKSHEVNCLMFGRGAEYAEVRNSGRALSFQEALEIIDATEEDGLVHTWKNSTSMAGSVLCNCCDDCCGDWEPLNTYGVPISQRLAKSRFEAAIDNDLCNGCQTCSDRCQFGAISMQQPAGSRKYKAILDAEKCYGCGVCVLGCATEAISMKLVRPADHIPAAQAPAN